MARHQRASHLRVCDVEPVPLAEVLRPFSELVGGRMLADVMTFGEPPPLRRTFVGAVEDQTRLGDGSYLLVHLDGNAAQTDPGVVGA